MESERKLEKERQEALEIIKDSEYMLEKCGGGGVDSDVLYKASTLLSKAQSSLNKQEYSIAIEYASQIEDVIDKYLEQKERIERALDIVKVAQSTIGKAKELGLDVFKANELIKNAEAALKAGNYKEATKLAKEAEEKALKIKKDREAYNEASDFISSIESEITKIKNSGIKIPKSDELIKEARSELNKKNYGKAKELAKEAKTKASERKSGYDLAFKSISEAERVLNETKDKGVIISSTEELLIKSKHTFDNGDYKEAIKLSEEIAKRIREESKPEIEVDLPEKTFKHDYWKTVNLIIRNKGNTPAKGVKIIFSKEVEVKGPEELLSVDSGEEKELSVVLKPNGLGDVPLEIKASYKDVDGKEYTAEKRFMLNVSEVGWKEEKKKEKKKAPTSFPTDLESFYSDIEYIGEGGFARIFKATRDKDGKEVAVKVPISLDRETGKSFTKEISNWSILDHENIVELSDLNILPVPYLEMELCDGNLEDEKKPMGVEKAASIIFNLAKGLKHAHSKGIIHRDLKPPNILFKNGKVKISDWGLSKLKVGSKSSSVVAFSPLYAAPEHFSKVRFGKTDERTDIYQLGVVFYELVTGKLPFGGEDVAEISFSIISEQPVPSAEINLKSKDIEHIIMKCIAKQKEERYQSVDELLGDLAVYLKEEYKKSRDFRKSAFFLFELLLHSVERGDTVEAVGWATEGLVSYPKRGYSEKEVQMLKNSIRELMDMKRNCCDKNTKVKDVNRRYDELKDNLVEEGFVGEIEIDKDLGMMIKEMNAELREGEYLDDKHVANLEYFCTKFIERWIAKFLR